MIKNDCVISNFNCTFDVNNERKPLLDYFEEIILPAFTDPNIKRVATNNKVVTAHYFLFDVKLVELEDNEIALVGKHVKRAFLKIDQDITPENGRVKIGKTIPSAPESNFILLLKNHRLIYFKEPSPGAPDIRSFNTTINSIVKSFIKKNKTRLINELKDSEFMYNQKKYNTITDFKTEVLNIQYPIPEINIVPIESEILVEEKFKSLSKVDNIKLYIYSLNSECHYDNYFNSISEFAKTVETTKIEQKFNNPKNLDQVKKMVTHAKGKIDYVVNARAVNNEKIKLTPKDVTETIPIYYSEDIQQEEKAKSVYKQVKHKDEIKETSNSNNIIYNSKLPILKKLIAKFIL